MRRHQSCWHSSTVSDVPTNTGFITGRARQPRFFPHFGPTTRAAELRPSPHPTRNPLPSSTCAPRKGLRLAYKRQAVKATLIAKTWKPRAENRFGNRKTERSVPTSGDFQPRKTEMASRRPYIKTASRDVMTHSPRQRRLRLLPPLPSVSSSPPSEPAPCPAPSASWAGTRSPA